jgi:hypothetical protein
MLFSYLDLALLALKASSPTLKVAPLHGHV